MDWPASIYDLDAERVARVLKVRRDKLDEAAADAEHEARGVAEGHPVGQPLRGPGEEGALPLQPQILGEQRAVRQGEEAVVAAVDHRPLGLDVEVVGVQPVEMGAVHRVHRTVGVDQDRATPHVVAARQVRRSNERFERRRVEPLDPRTFVLAPLGLLLVAMTAAAIPAMRAGRIDPATTLRRE